MTLQLKKTSHRFTPEPSVIVYIDLNAVTNCKAELKSRSKEQRLTKKRLAEQKNLTEKRLSQLTRTFYIRSKEIRVYSLILAYLLDRPYNKTEPFNTSPYKKPKLNPPCSHRLCSDCLTSSMLSTMLHSKIICLEAVPLLKGDIKAWFDGSKTIAKPFDFCS